MQFFNRHIQLSEIDEQGVSLEIATLAVQFSSSPVDVENRIYFD